MESHGGFRSLPTIEEVVTTLILLCAALYCQIKSEMESLMGFKFQPSNEQIFCLLEKKRLNPHFSHHTIKDIDDICSLEPWDLPGASKPESEDQALYFFYKPYYKYRESTRAHRRTTAGYWKVTGRGSKIKARNGLTGSKKILTFYCHHGPASKKAKKTDWVMHEYHVKDDPSYKKEFVLCRIERKWDNKHGISTTDEVESRQQLVSPIQLSPRDPRNHSEENSLTNPQQLPNHNLISYPGNHIEQNTLTFPQLIPNASLISPTQLLPNGQLNSNRIHSEENILTNQQLQPNHNLISHFGNQIEENIRTNPQLLPNSNSISFPANLIELPTEQLPSDRLISMRNHIEENIMTNQQLQPDHNLIYHFGNQIVQNSPANPQLPPNSNLISFPGNLIQQNTVTNPHIPNHGLIFPTLLLPSDHLISKQNLSEENSLKSLHLQPNHNLISNFGNQIKENSPTNPQLPPNSNLESQLLLNQPMVIHDFAESTFQEEHLLPGEFNACGRSNRRNDDSFSAMQPVNQEQEFMYSNCSFDNCDFFDQVNDLINSPGAFEDENSRKETGRTLTPDLNSSKSDGGASTYAKDSSDTNNTADIDAWLNGHRAWLNELREY